MELWEIKKDILNSVYKRTDGIGPGYSLSLPWPSYRPDITEVHLRVHYDADKGAMPVYAQDQVLTMNNGSNGIPTFTQRSERVNGQPVVTGPPGPVPPVNATPMPQPGTMPPPAGGPVQPTGAFQPSSFGAAPAAVAVPMPPPAPRWPSRRRRWGRCSRRGPSSRHRSGPLRLRPRSRCRPLAPRWPPRRRP